MAQNKRNESIRSRIRYQEGKSGEPNDTSNEQIERGIQQRAWARQNWKQWNKDQNASESDWVIDIKPEEPEEFSHPAWKMKRVGGRKPRTKNYRKKLKSNKKSNRKKLKSKRKKTKSKK